MARRLSEWNTKQLQSAVLEPRWLITVGETHISTLGHTVYELHTYLQASVNLQFSDDWTCRVAIQDSRGYYQARISQSETMSVSLLYGNTGFSDGDADLYWRGRVFSRSVSEDVLTLVGRLGGVQLFPGVIANSLSGFNHLIPHGARVIMPDGIHQFDN